MYFAPRYSLILRRSQFLLACVHARLEQIGASCLLHCARQMLTSPSGILARGGLHERIVWLTDARNICVCVYRVKQDDRMVGFGQSTYPFPFFLRCKQHSLLYIFNLI
jgi:hypothetical protein